MASKAALAIALLMAASLAGCAGDGDGDGSSSSSSTTGSRITYTATVSSTSSTSGTTTSGSGTSTGPGNQAPTGALAVSLNGTKATFNLTGSDPDGDAIVWELDFGDGNSTNGTVLPASVQHAYNKTGNLTAAFALTDGTARTVYNVTLAVGPAGAAFQDIDASWEPATNPACADSSAPYDAVPGSFVEFAVEAGTWGKAFTATFDSGAAQDHVLFLDAAGAELLHATTGLPTDPDWITEGSVPAGAATVVFFGCFGLPSEHVVYHAG